MSKFSNSPNKTAVKRLVNTNVISNIKDKRGSPKTLSNRLKSAKKPVKLQERSELSIMFDKIRQKNTAKEKLEPKSDNKLNAVKLDLEKPKISESPNLKINKVGMNNVNSVSSLNIGRINENIDDIDTENVMVFNEMGKLVPKTSQKSQLQEPHTTHAPKLGLKFKGDDWLIGHKDSPEKLDYKSKLSIFENKNIDNIDSVNSQTNLCINPNIIDAKSPLEKIERSASFTSLVGNPNHKIRKLSRRISNSVGTDLDSKKNRKESIGHLTPLRLIGSNPRSEILGTDSPGKRKFSPESNNLDSKKVRSGNRTKGGF